MKTKSELIKMLSLLAFLLGTSAVFGFYDPAVQRWINRDPLGELPDGPNLYALVRNQPTRYFDADGRFAPIAWIIKKCVQRLIVGETGGGWIPPKCIEDSESPWLAGMKECHWTCTPAHDGDAPSHPLKISTFAPLQGTCPSPWP
jgi:hypothetical protein